MEWVTDHADVTPQNSLITDRTFLVKAPRILKAAAALDGRSRVEVRDILALKYMTTFRVPASVHAEVPAFLESVVESYYQPVPPSGGGEGGEADGGGEGGPPKVPKGYGKFGENVPGKSASPPPAPKAKGEGEEAEEQAEVKDKPPKKKKKKAEAEEKGEDKDETMERDGLTTKSYPVLLKETLIRPLMRLWGSAQGPNVKLNLESSAVEGAERVLHALRGRKRRSKSSADPAAAAGGPVGLPRQRGRLTSLNDPNLLQDSDIADLSSWLVTGGGSLPRGLLREPKVKGGSVAFVRDVSDSMWGGRVSAHANAATVTNINTTNTNTAAVAANHHRRRRHCLHRHSLTTTTTVGDVGECGDSGGDQPCRGTQDALWILRVCFGAKVISPDGRR